MVSKTMVGKQLFSCLAIIMLALGARVSAGEVYVGGGALSRSFNGDGKIAWSTTTLQDGTVVWSYQPFQLTTPINYTPKFLGSASGYRGFNWTDNTSRTGKVFIGYNFSRRIALQGTFQVATTLKTANTETGSAGSGVFTERLITIVRHSAISLESKFFPLGKWVYLLAGLERSHVSIQIGGAQSKLDGSPGFVYSMPLGEGKTDIAPIVGGGVELYFDRNLGIFVQASYSYSEFENFADGTSALESYPSLQFDTGGLVLFAGVTVKLRNSRR